MLALSLTVALLSSPAAPSPQARLVPLLALAGEGEPTPASQPPPAVSARPEPSLALTPPRGEVTWRGVLASSGFVLVSDLLIGAAALYVYAELLDATFSGQGGGGGAGLLVALAAAWVFVPPFFAVIGAEGGLGKRGDRGAAYGVALAIRLGGLLFARIFPPAVLVTELVLAPLAATKLVADSAAEHEAARAEAAARARSPASYAHPEPEPGRAR